jgi:hypothetical protein
LQLFPDTNELNQTARSQLDSAAFWIISSALLDPIPDEAPPVGEPNGEHALERHRCRDRTTMSVSPLAAEITVLTVCPLEDAVQRLQYYNVQLNAQLAKQQEPLMDEMSQISAKATIPNLAIGKQLSESDLERFQRLREQMMALQAREVINSEYLRGSNVIAQSAKVAYDLSQGREFNEQDHQYF